MLRLRCSPYSREYIFLDKELKSSSDYLTDRVFILKERWEFVEIENHQFSLYLYISDPFFYGTNQWHCLFVFFLSKTSALNIILVWFESRYPHSIQWWILMDNYFIVQKQKQMIKDILTSSTIRIILLNQYTQSFDRQIF